MGKKSLTWIRLIMICYHGDHLGCQIRLPLAIQNLMFEVSGLPPWPPSWILKLNNLAILNLHVTPMPPIKFQLNLTIQNFHNTPIPPNMFKLSQTYHLVADVI